MARLHTIGFESGHALAEQSISTLPPSWLFAPASGGGVSTARARGGQYSFLYNGTALQFRNPGINATSGQPRYQRFCLNLETVPGSAGPWIIKQQDPQWRLTNARALTLWWGTLQYTSPALNLDQWYVIETYSSINDAGGVNDVLIARIDGVEVHNSTGDRSITGSTNFDIGTAVAAAGLKYYIDDIAVNDTTGSSQNSWCGFGKVELLKPMADSAVGTNWVRGDGTTGSMFQAVDNIPPIGTAAGAAGTQVRNAVATASNLDLAVESYDEAGIPSGDSIEMVQGLARVGVSSLTGTNTGTGRLLSNPDEGATHAINYEISGATQGTDNAVTPAGWVTRHGAAVYSPSVTRATRPVMRISRTTDGSTRQHSADLIGVLVEHLTPPPSGDDWEQPVDDTASVTDTLAKLALKGLTEAPTATDSFAKVAAYVRALVEGPTATDAVVKKPGKALVEAPTVTDSITAARGTTKALAETASTVTDAVAKAPKKAVAENASTVTDAVAKKPTKALAENASTVTDAVAKAPKKALAENASTVTDSTSRVWAAKQTVADTASATDSTSRVWAAKQTVAETPTVTDVIDVDLTTGSIPHTRSVPDTAAATDSIVKAPKKAIAETASVVTDATSRAWAAKTAVADSAAGTDAITRKHLVKTIADSATATDASTKAVTRTTADVGQVTDFVQPAHGGAVNWQLPLSENLTALDATTVVEANRVQVDESANATDAIGKTHRKTVSDSAAATDLLSRSPRKAISDTSAATDARSAAYTKPVGDTASVTDSSAKTWTAKLPIADGATIQDAVNISGGGRTSLSDTATVTDSISFAGTYAHKLDLADGLAATDARTSRTFKVAADTASLTDASSRQSAHLVADTAQLTDASSRGTGRLLAESAAVTDAVSPRGDTKRTVSDSASVGDSMQIAGGDRTEINDSLIVTDQITFTATQQHTLSISDGVAATDAVAKTVRRTQPELITVADTLNRAWAFSRTLADGLAATDTVTRVGLAKQLSENAALADEVRRKATTRIADFATVTDGIATTGVEGEVGEATVLFTVVPTFTAQLVSSASYAVDMELATGEFEFLLEAAGVDLATEEADSVELIL